MQVCLRRARPGELDPELLWLLVSITAAVASAAWLRVGLPWPHCLFLAWTGHPCVTCGATRSAMQFVHGHFLESLRWNPLAFVLLCAISLFDAYAAVVIVARTPRIRLEEFSAGQKNWMRILILLLLALNWIYLLTRPVSYA